MKIFNPNEFKRIWSVMFAPDSVVEVRIIGNKGKSDIRSGYFKSAETAADVLMKEGSSLYGCNIYWTLNALHNGCYSRLQRDRILKNPITTSDSDITRRLWLPIDVDAARPSGCSSSEDELKAAVECVEKITEYVISQGLPRPLRQYSGNGAHCLIPIDWANNDRSKDTAKSFLQHLGKMFDNAAVHVDQTTYNSARVLKAAGTLAAKGYDAPERPWRFAYAFEEDTDYVRPEEVWTLAD